MLARVSCLLAVLLAALALGSLDCRAASTGAMLYRIQGTGAGTNNGDYVSDTAAMADVYHYWIEVPPSATQLVIDIFDPDVGQAGNADDAGDRDRLRNAWNTTVTYSLFQPSGAGVAPNFTTGSTALPAGSDNTWVNFATIANPAAGHWEVRIAMGGGDDVNAFGLRASSQAGGPELNIYADNFFGIGSNALGGAGNTNSFTFYPYITSGCTINHKDFDLDSANALSPGGVQQSVTYTNRTGLYTTTFGNAALSAATVWANNAAPVSGVGASNPSGTESLRLGMGIWTAQYVVNEVAGGNANFGTIVIGDDTNAAVPTAASVNPLPSAFRVYEPTSAGGVPQLPYLIQDVLWSSGPNPPVSGSTTVFNVGVKFTNPTANAVNFSATNLIQIRIPNYARFTYVAGSLSVTQGTATLNPAASVRNLTIKWNPGAVTAGTTVEMAYQVSFAANDAAIHNLTGAGNLNNDTDNVGTRANFVDATGNVTQARATFAFGGLCPLTVQAGVAVPTPVTLSWMRAARSGGDIAIDWTTDSEIRNVAFDIYGRRGNNWTKLTAQPIPSKRGNSAEPQSYSAHVAAPDDVTEVALQDIAYDGKRKLQRAVALGGEIGARIVPHKIDWVAVIREHLGHRNNAIASGSPRAYVQVDADGLWRVRASDLAAAGTDFSAVAHADLALTGADGPVPLRLSNTSGAQFGSTGTIEFYGRMRHSLYGKRNVYTLSVDPASARRVHSVTGAGSAWTSTLTRYMAESSLQRDLNYSFASISDDPWFDSELLAFAGAPQQYDFTVPVNALASVSDGTVAIDVTGQSDWSDVVNDHRLQISVNGTPIATQDFPGISRQLLRFVLPNGILVEGNNQITLRQPADNVLVNEHDLVDVERLSLGYPRQFIAQAGAIDASLAPPGDNAPGVSDTLFVDSMGDTPEACATVDCAAIQIGGFGAGAVQAYAIGESETLYFADASNQSGTVRVVVPTAPQWRVVAFADSAIRSPVLSAAPDPIELATPAATLLIVSHPDFAGSLGSFVSARQAEGLSVRVVTTDQVYARYGKGNADPTAIRALLAEAYAAGTRYALLVGGDTYDYDNHLGQGAISFVPAPYTWTGDIVRYAPSDTLLGDVDGDGLSDIAVGRWPVRNAADLSAVIQKTLVYATANLNGRAVFAAGGSDSDLNFTTLNGQVSAALGASGWAIDRIEIDSSGVSAANSSLIDAINQGRGLTNFVGHSSVDRWTFDPLFTIDQAQSALTNANQPTVIAQWGCWSSYFVSPSYNSMAHSFLLDAGGGAAAVIGAGTLVDTPQQDDFISAFLGRAADGSMRIGDALDATRRDFAVQHPERRDMIYGINLLGDPTLRLRH